MGGRGGSSGLYGSGGNGGIGKLPDLQGSEKQVQWANNIRDGYVKNYTLNDLIYGDEKTVIKTMDVMENITGNRMSFYGKENKHEQLQREFKENNPRPERSDKQAMEKYKKKKAQVEINYKKWLYNEFKKVLKSQTSASWWIDHR